MPAVSGAIHTTARTEWRALPTRTRPAYWDVEREAKAYSH